MRRAGGFVLAAVCAGTLLMPAAANAGPYIPRCPDLQFQLGQCPRLSAPAPGTRPDPGGSETVTAPVPSPGRGFGFSANIHRHQSLTPEEEADLSARVGATHARIAVAWQFMQYSRTDPPLTTSGTGDAALNVAWLDRRYAALLAKGITPIIHVIQAPRWSSRWAKQCPLTEVNCTTWRNRSDAWGDAGYYFPDRDQVGAYVAFTMALAARYPQADFEGWNEPNLYFDTESERAYEPWAPSPEEFIDLHCAAYREFKRVYPGRTFIGPSFLHLGWNRWWEYMTRAYDRMNGQRCWDAFTIHRYHARELTFGAGSRFAEFMDHVRSVRAQRGDTVPMWMTETGWPTGGTSTWELATDEAGQRLGAERLYNRLMGMPDIAGVLFHTLRDPEVRGTDTEHFYGFLNGDETPKLAFCAFVTRSAHTYSGC